ncbi:MAG: rRNA methyltransferase, partial [Dactylosporangium sp.]|nr:rRNA methyltransferase [Dactylosporangium sp.]
YQHVRHHESIADFVAWARDAGLPVIGIDNLPGSRPIESADLPRRCVMLFGQEGPGLSAAARAACEQILHITQYGSTRSINAGVASGIAMHAWIRRHAAPHEG